METLQRHFRLYKQGKTIAQKALVSGTHAESAQQALDIMGIITDDITVESTAGHVVTFRYNNTTYVLIDTGYV